MICKKCKSEKFKDFDETFYVCRTCGTLAEKPAETVIEAEVIDMGDKCKEPGCTKWDSVKGYCVTHARENGFGEAVRIRNIGGSLKSPDGVAKCPDVGVISIIDAAWADSRKRILSTLQTADNRKRLEYSLSVVTTIEALGL